MTRNFPKCYTCLKVDAAELYPLQNLADDHITYLEQLKSFIGTNLVDSDRMEICTDCIAQLRISYLFRTTVLHSQQALMQLKDEIKDEYIYESDIKYDLISSDPRDDDFVPDESDNNDESDDDNKDEIKPKRRYHTSKTDSDLNLTCDLCGSKFNKHWKLKKHGARVHSQVRNHVCTYCQKEFKQKFHLKEHMTSHTGEKNYSCPLCDKKFQRLSSQKRHMQAHNRAPGQKTKRTPFLCTICGKSFPFSNGVQRHMRIHLGIKNFQCNLCNRRFTQSTHLQVHMRTHTGEKPYICDTCGEKFSIKACLMKHINSKHTIPKIRYMEFMLDIDERDGKKISSV